MIVDALTQFSGSIVGNTVTGQSLTSGTITSTNVIDLAGVGTGNTARDLGQGEELDIVIEVTTTFSGGTSLVAQLVCADDTGISVNVTPIVATPSILTAALVAGNQVVLHVDRASMTQAARRYLALQYVITGTYTAGALIAFIPNEVQDKGNNTIFNSGFAVS